MQRVESARVMRLPGVEAFVVAVDVFVVTKASIKTTVSPTETAAVTKTVMTW
jgi:hypothetical protein